MSTLLVSGDKVDGSAFWLADLTHYGRTPASETIPIGIAFVASYTRQLCGLRERIRLFRYPRALADAIEHQPLPSVLGFSNYIWNSSLSLAFARVVRRRSPSTTVVMGGPHLPRERPLTEVFLRAHPEVDYYIEGEGEAAFGALAQLIVTMGDWRAAVSDCVPSLRWLDSTGRFRSTPLAKRFTELDVIPSPYLDGTLDEFFDGELAPTLQTNRGCPFGCTFCTEGGAYYRSVASFSAERVAAELEYIGAKMEHLVAVGARNDLLITDSNFAMYANDRATCARIKACRDRYGWPARVNVTTGKNRRERVLQSVSLAEGAIQLSGAVQSLERTVLANINRANIDAEALIDIARKSADRGTPTYSDVILGLPGDTRESHVATVSTLVEAGFGRINTFQCSLLPGTELYSDAMRTRFGIKTRFRIVPRGWGRYQVGSDDVCAVEIDEVVVETADMTFEDYVWCRIFDLALFILYNDGIMAATVSVAGQMGIDLGAYLKRAAEAEWPGRLGKIREDYARASREQLFASEEECEAFAMRNVGGAHGDHGRNLLYTYRASAITDALQEVGELALYCLREDLASRSGRDLLAEAVAFDTLGLVGIFDRRIEDAPVHGRFAFDIPSIAVASELKPRGIPKWDEPVEIVFEMSDTSRATRDAYARAMGGDASGIGRALSRVPIGELRRVARVGARS